MGSNKVNGLLGSTWNKSDGGSKIFDFVAFGFLIVMVTSVLVSSVYVYVKRKEFQELRLRSSALILQIIQSIAGLFWFVGFAVKIGTFNRGRFHNPQNEIRPLSMCSFWNFGIAMLLGYGVWTAMINLRLMRIYWFFVLKKDKIKLGSFATLSFKGSDQYKILMLLYSPFLLFYGFLLIPLGASHVKRIGGDSVCLYSNDVFKWIDILFFAGTMVGMSILTFACRHVQDDLGENLAMQKSIRVSLLCLGTCSIVDLLGIDGLCIGRTLVSTSIALTVMTYYYLQNSEYLRKVIQQDKSVPPEVARVFDRILSGSGMGFDAEALEGGDMMKKNDDHYERTEETSTNNDLDRIKNTTTTLRRRTKKTMLTEEERERREKFNKSLLDIDNDEE